MKLFLELFLILLIIALVGLAFALPAAVLQFIGAATLVLGGIAAALFLIVSVLAKAMAS